MSSENPAARIVIIGRPNVGKSTLFNRLTRTRRALVHDMPGVTRDRQELETAWTVGGRDRPVRLTDTGGVGGERFAREIEQQVGIALRSADAVLAVFDGKAGLTPEDEELMRRLAQTGLPKRVPVVGVVNKVDAEAHEGRISDFYALGLDTLVTVSAEHGRGISDLEDAVFTALGQPGPEAVSDEAEVGTPRPEKRTEWPAIAIVGRPNVGKSTLLNALAGEIRMITSPEAGTTIDSVDTPVRLGGKPYLVIDTAGIRRKSKTEQGIEVLSVLQARRSLERAELALLVLDGEKGITDQDEKIGGLIEESGCSVILMINKWDTQRRNPKFTQAVAAERIRGKMAYLKYAPLMFVSALQRRGLDDLGGLISDILHQRSLKLPTHELTEWTRREATIHNPMNAKFFFVHQSGRHPPTFVFHVSDPEKVHFSLRRHLANALRERWGFMGSPVRLVFVSHDKK